MQVTTRLVQQQQEAVVIQKLMEDVTKISPSDESVDDHAQVVDRSLSDLTHEATDKVGRLEVELSEVRTEDEAPEIEDFMVSPLSEQRVEEKLTQLDEPAQHFAERKEFSKRESKFETQYSDLIQYSEDEKESHEFSSRPMILDIQAQSSLEVEVGSRESDECMFAEDEKMDNSESRMELLMRSFAKDMSEIISGTPVGGLPDITEEENIQDVCLKKEDDVDDIAVHLSSGIRVKINVLRCHIAFCTLKISFFGLAAMRGQ